MNITLYKTQSENNAVTKTLTNAIALSGTLKESSSVLSPSILIQSATSLATYNYMYIKEFDRYYFITEIEVVRNNLWRITGRVDVLMSYASEIRQLSGIILRQENVYDNELDDKEVTTQQNVVVSKVEYPETPFEINPTNGIVLVVLGKSEVISPT